MSDLVQRVARTWTRQFQDPHLRQLPRGQSPTEFGLRQLHLPVSNARFEAAMGMAARDMGGTYHPATATIRLPPGFARPGDATFPTELRVLYRKFPCAAIMRDPDPESPVATMPCVSFDVIPNISGDPRRSKIFQSFQGDAASSKRMFGKFLGWLKIVSKAVHRYVKTRDAERAAPFAQVMASEDAVARVAATWLLRCGGVRKPPGSIVDSSPNDPGADDLRTNARGWASRYAQDRRCGPVARSESSEIGRGRS